MIRSSSPVSRSRDASPNRTRIRCRVLPASSRYASANDKYSYVRLSLRTFVVFTNIHHELSRLHPQGARTVVPTKPFSDPQSEPKTPGHSLAAPRKRPKIFKLGAECWSLGGGGVGC